MMQREYDKMIEKKTQSERAIKDGAFKRICRIMNSKSSKSSFFVEDELIAYLYLYSNSNSNNKIWVDAGLGRTTMYVCVCVKAILNPLLWIFKTHNKKKHREREKCKGFKWKHAGKQASVEIDSNEKNGCKQSHTKKSQRRNTHTHIHKKVI